MKNRKKFVAAATALIALAVPAVANAGVIQSVDSTQSKQGTTYHVTPTQEGRSMGSSGANYNPRGEMTIFGIPTTDSLVNQLVCHIVFAGDKPQWNLEDWRPAVGQSQMIATKCNPTGENPGGSS